MHKQSGLYYFHAVLYTQTSFIPMQSCSCLPRTRGWWCEGLFRRNRLGTHGCCRQLHYTCMQSSDVLAMYLLMQFKILLCSRTSGEARRTRSINVTSSNELRLEKIRSVFGSSVPCITFVMAICLYYILPFS